MILHDNDSFSAALSIQNSRISSSSLRYDRKRFNLSASGPGSERNRETSVTLILEWNRNTLRTLSPVARFSLKYSRKKCLGAYWP
jgi:hypothetical protein